VLSTLTRAIRSAGPNGTSASRPAREPRDAPCSLELGRAHEAAQRVSATRQDAEDEHGVAREAGPGRGGIAAGRICRGNRVRAGTSAVLGDVAHAQRTSAISVHGECRLEHLHH
jgi:hypothetical protein